MSDFVHSGMDDKEPALRFGKTEVIKELGLELSIPCEEDLQDWSYIVADENNINFYISHYDQLEDQEKKFILMEIIIQATSYQTNLLSLKKYWKKG
jgi:hypothetical protein